MKRPSPSLVVSILALFVALGGTGYAAMKLNGKNIVNRSIPANKLKKNSVGGVEVREKKLGKVPAAARADNAGVAAVAGNAEKLGGRPASSFASAGFHVHRYTEATRDGSATILQSGPFKLTLLCVPGFNGQDTASARLQIEIADASRGTPTGAADTPYPADTTIVASQTPGGNTSSPQFRMLAGYFDTAGGRSLDYNVRLRSGAFDAQWCSAVTQATLGGN